MRNSRPTMVDLRCLWEHNWVCLNFLAVRFFSGAIARRNRRYKHKCAAEFFLKLNRDSHEPVKVHLITDGTLYARRLFKASFDNKELFCLPVTIDRESYGKLILFFRSAKKCTARSKPAGWFSFRLFWFLSTPPNISFALTLKRAFELTLHLK